MNRAACNGTDYMAMSTPPLMPSLSGYNISPYQQPLQHYEPTDHYNYFLHSGLQPMQWTYNASSNDQIDAYNSALQSYAHEFGGNFDIFGQSVEPTWAANEILTALSSTRSEAAGGFADRSEEKLDHSFATNIGEAEISSSKSPSLMGLTSAVSGDCHEGLTHNTMSNYDDQGCRMVGLSTTSCPPGPDTAIFAECSSADTADHQRMQQEAGRISALITRGSSGIANCKEAQYTVSRIMSTSGLVLQQLQEAQGDHTFIFAGSNYIGASDQNHVINRNVNSVSSPQLDEGVKNYHVVAERKRRRKEGDCLEVLRTLVPNIAKKAKVTTLERTIEYLKEMKGLVNELEQEKVSLDNSNDTDSRGEMGSSCNSHHGVIVTNQSKNINSQTNATCQYIHSNSAKGISPHFQLKVATSVKDVSANVPILEIISALQTKNLHCIEFKSKILKHTRNFGAKLLAKYKDGESCTPNLDEINDIEQWWKHLIEDKLSEKWKP